MPTFICAKCGCIDNTATSSYWHLDIGCVANNIEYHPTLEAYKHKPLCSECGCVRLVRKPDGSVVRMVVPGKWHNKFQKEKATEAEKRSVSRDGFLH